MRSSVPCRMSGLSSLVDIQKECTAVPLGCQEEEARCARGAASLPLRSECQSQAELHDARRFVAGNGAGVSLVQRVVGQVQIGVIGDVERLPSELRLGALANLK